VDYQFSPYQMVINYIILNVDHQDYLKLLEFNDEWLRLGILTENELSILGHEYEASDQKGTA
jgi:hypothetical protein